MAAITLYVINFLVCLYVVLPEAGDVGSRVLARGQGSLVGATVTWL